MYEARHIYQIIFMKNRLLPHFTILFYFFVALLSHSCKNQPKTLFQLLTSERTGIHFSNTITENDTMNILSTEYIYNGGGVGIGDFNNDGLQDIFLPEIWFQINCT